MAAVLQLRVYLKCQYVGSLCILVVLFSVPSCAHTSFAGFRFHICCVTSAHNPARRGTPGVYVYDYTYYTALVSVILFCIQYDRSSDCMVAAKRGALRKELKNGLPTGTQ